MIIFEESQWQAMTLFGERNILSFSIMINDGTI